MDVVHLGKKKCLLVPLWLAKFSVTSVMSGFFGAFLTAHLPGPARCAGTFETGGYCCKNSLSIGKIMDMTWVMKEHPAGVCPKDTFTRGTV